MAVQYGLDFYEEDLADVKRTLNRVSRPVLLVGHSYSGATVTGAAPIPRSRALSTSRGLAPDVGETVQDQLNKYPSEIFNHVEAADDRAWMLQSGAKHFAGDPSEEEQKVVWATHYPPSTDPFNQQKLTADQVAWRTKPSWHVLATQDHTVNPDLQRWVSRRIGAPVTEVTSSHVPMLSKPDVVIDVIRKAAAAI